MSFEYSIEDLIDLVENCNSAISMYEKIIIKLRTKIKQYEEEIENEKEWRSTYRAHIQARGAINEKQR